MPPTAVDSAQGRPPRTHEAIAHDAVEAFQRLQVLVGEVELDHPGVPEQRAQRGLQEIAASQCMRRGVRGGQGPGRGEERKGKAMGRGRGPSACRSPAAAAG